MRKFNFYSIVALVGAMVLSMSSCTKDLEDDVDALKKEVAANKDAIAALDKAIKAGSRITAVTPVATGFEMTFSDGSKITVLHGQNGANGSNGSNGNDGINGTDGFTPIIGIDSENYWTVVSTKDGEPERILVDGKPVKAVGTANVEVKGGYLWIDGVITELGGLPTFVLDEANGVAHITMFDADGVEKNFTVLLDGALAGVNSMVRSVVAPLSMIAIDLTYGVAENTFVGGPFAGKVTKDKVYKSGGVLPVIINPSNATITKDQITIENAKGVKLPIEVSSVVKGFEGEMERVSPITRAAATNGLWSINLAITPEILESESEEFLNYAVKVAKSETEAVYSGYEYQIAVVDAETLNITSGNFGRSITAKEILFAGAEKTIATGTTESLYVVDPANILMSRVDFKNESDKVAYGKYIECTATGVKMKKDDEATHLALNTKKIDFVYTVVDYNGASVAYPNGVYTAAREIVVGITFNSTFGQDEYALSAVNHTLTIDLPETTGVDETIKLADLDELYNQLGAAKEALWRENATALTVKVVDKDNAVAAGVTAKVVDKDGGVVALGSAFPKNIQFTFDPTVALPGKYTAEFTYTDKRGTTAKTFVVKVPVTITNPTMETAVKFRVPAYFTGDNATVYGTASGTPNVGQATNPASIDLKALYNIDKENLAFEITPIEGITTTLTGNVLTIDGDMMYNNFRVKVIYQYFGNVNNTNVLFDEINVQAKSEVREGDVIILTPAAPNKVKPLEVVAGDQTTQANISESYVAKDYYGNDLGAFGDVANKNGRAKVVTVKRDLTDGNYSLVTEPVYDTTTKAWVVTASDKLIQLTSVDVKLIVEIEDLFGQKLVRTISVKVKKTK